ncbi:MAG TPA: hypothetical protein VKL21_04855 [Candidatus Methanoperedens sp.]|nr:hypothetical protein [Candidatus Methanoperedens sp.]
MKCNESDHEFGGNAKFCPENKYLKLMNKNRTIISIVAVTLFIVTLGCIGSTQDKIAISPLPTPQKRFRR